MAGQYRNDLVADVTMGVSDVLNVRAGQTITDYHPERFRKIIIRKDPVTGAAGLLVHMYNNQALPITSDDLIVTEDTTALNEQFPYNNVIIFGGNTLTVES